MFSAHFYTITIFLLVHSYAQPKPAAISYPTIAGFITGMPDVFRFFFSSLDSFAELQFIMEFGGIDIENISNASFKGINEFAFVAYCLK